jgi:hypothetical protein
MTTTQQAQQGIKVPSQALRSDGLSVRSDGRLGSDGERSSHGDLDAPGVARRPL